MASFWRKKSEPSSTWSVGTNLSIGSTHQTMKNVNTLVIRLYRNNATDPELWMVLMQPDQQVAIDLNCSNADDGTVSLSIGAAVACRPIAKLNFVFDWSRESYRKCNCTQLVIPRIKAQLATPPVPCPISGARRRSSRHHSWWRCGTVTERQRIHAWCPSIGSMHEIMKTVLTSAAIILSQNNIVRCRVRATAAASCNQLDFCSGDNRTVSWSIWSSSNSLESGSRCTSVCAVSNDRSCYCSCFLWM